MSSEFPPGPGGIGTHAYQLARQLSRLGWEIAVVAPQDYASDREIESFNHVQPFDIRRLPRAAIRLATVAYRWRAVTEAMRGFDADLVLATGARAVCVTAAISLGTPFRWVAIGHGTEFGARGPWNRRIIRWAYQRASCLICVSRYTWQYVQSAGIRPRRGYVIPNGADDSLFRILEQDAIDRFRARLPAGARRILLTIGNVTARKGQEVVIRALPRILRSCPGTHYFVIGLPSETERLKKLAAQLSVGEHVHFLGRLPNEEVVQWLNACDLFVMTSRNTVDGDFEGFGIAVVEAALCGKPAVVSANCGLSEAIVDGTTGLAVPQNDPAATAEAVVSLIRDDAGESRRRMGSASRVRALREQTWRHRARQYDVVLRRVVDGSTAVDSPGRMAIDVIPNPT